MLDTIHILTKADMGDVGSTEVLNTIEKAKSIDSDMVGDYLKEFLPHVLDFAIQLIIAVLVYLVGVWLIRLLRKTLRKWMERRDVDTGVRQFVDALTKYVCYFLLFMILLRVFGIMATSTIAVLGSAGLTIGLALQGSLSNFAGGVLILVLKPFKVGDYIIEDSHKNEGIVHEISIFYTKLATSDHKIIIVPNGTLANTSLTNVTQSNKRRVDIFVNISYQADLKKAKQVIYELLEKDPYRLAEEEVDVFVAELGSSAVRMGIYVWVPTENYWTCKCRLLEELKNTLDENEIEIAFSQLDVKIKQ